MTLAPSNPIRPHWSWRPFYFWRSWRFGWYELTFLALALAALGLRLWELDGRTMHYDEAIHIQAGWVLSEGGKYLHSPWMHGPFQIEFNSLIFRLFGDTNATARLGYVLFGTALVGLPYFLRDYLGRAGALFAGVMLALSPALLYFSRFGREDIIMAFWAAALLVLAWRYMHENRRRYLYLASAVLAFMFATKETSYFVALFFGLLTFLLALPSLVPWLLGRVRTVELTGPAGFFLLILTLTLPQWAPAVSLFQDYLGVTLANPDGVQNGLVGAPQWEAPFLELPVYNGSWWFHGLAAALLVGALFWLSQRRRAARVNPARQYRRAFPRLPLTEIPLSGESFGRPAAGVAQPPGGPGLSRARTVAGHRQYPGTIALLTGVAVPLAMVAATCLAVFRPLEDAAGFGSGFVPDFLIDGLLGVAAVAALVRSRHPWKRSLLLIILPTLLTLLYVSAFTTIINVDSLINDSLPSGIQVDASVNGIPVNFLVAGGILATLLVISIWLGMTWAGGVWLTCAAIFYLVWGFLYTTFFTNWAGVFSGVWQGMGYWIAQQDVARGGQPWYYYFVELSVYELLPLVFGIAGAVYFLRKGDLLGLALAFWSGITLLLYTIASEKMPWLLIHITLPFILLSARFLGDLAEQVSWRQVITRGQVSLLLMPPLAIAALVYLLYQRVDGGGTFSASQWSILVSAALLALASAYIVRLARPRRGVPLVGLGLAALLLAFGVVGAFRAAYTFDDSNVEMLVYAQGSSDLPKTFDMLRQRVFNGNPEPGAVTVDYDMWYPFQWYVRKVQKEDLLRFSCFKKEGEEGYYAGCRPVQDNPDYPALLLTTVHGSRDSSVLQGEYQREGPYRNLLWFPETYRRPHENRRQEGLKVELSKDFDYFKEVVSSQKSWQDALDYLLFRRLDHAWYDSQYYTYLAAN